MSTSDSRHQPANSAPNSSPPITTPDYGSTSANPPSNIESARKTRCATGLRFITTIHGILNIIAIVALVCVIISAGVADRQDGIDADDSSLPTKGKVSAFHTRNAVLVFAVFGLFLVLVDSILHVSKLINRLPSIFDSVFIVIMLVLALIYLILGCCAAAWEQKMRDTLGPNESLKRRGAAASAAFFIFIAMISIIINFILRLITRPSQSYNP